MSDNSQVDVISRQTRKFPKPSVALRGENPTSGPEPATPASTVTVTAIDSKPEVVSLSPEATTIFLPSRCEFYEFSAISLGRFKGFHQAKFYRAATEHKDRHAADAITSLLPPGIKSEELTIPDFYFVMYWLRLSTYMRTELVHTGVCTNPAHLEAVRKKQKDSKTLTSVEVITKTRLEQVELSTTYLEGFEDGLTVLTEALNPLGYTITAPRMFDVIDLNENYADDPNFEEISYLSDKASCLVRVDGVRTTLKERIQIVETLDIAVLEYLEEWRVRCSSYGVRESIKFKCKECGADVENDISISAHSFL
jgi:hypothetical protein